MIVGAHKAGTSSLSFYLGQHPDICTHEQIELSYFVNDQDHALGYAANYDRYFADCSPSSRILGKSVTVMTDEVPVLRMRDHNPGMRLVAVLRNPVDRAYSAFWWARRKGYEALPTFEEAIAADARRHRGNVVRVRSTSYISFGLYAEQVAMLHRAFAREQVQLHLFEDLQADALATCRRIFEHVGVDSTFQPDVSRRRNTMSLARSAAVARLLSSQFGLKRRIRQALPRGVAERWKSQAERWNRVPFDPPPMRPETREQLVARFTEDNERLGELIGRDLTAWNRVPTAATIQAEG
jgi:hypothetical protein